MTQRAIELPEEVYSQLLEVARKRGISPVDWIATQLSQTTESIKPLPELLSGLTGVIDSRTETPHASEKTSFGEGVAAKLAKQGIRRP